MNSIQRWKKILQSVKQMDKRIELLESNMESLLVKEYSSLSPETNYKELFKSKEFKVYSQNGEDGLLLYIFSLIGTTNRTLVEFGFGDGKQCMAANLVKNFGFNGLMMDGNPMHVRLAKSFYKDFKNVRIEESFLTKENINEKIESFGIKGEIDLLSVDIDGNDYWVWQAINVITPRVVVVEYNASFGQDRSVTVEYDSVFDRFQKNASGWYHGASLRALESLGKEKGYALVGCDSRGVNAFFVKKNLLKDGLNVISSSEAYYSNTKRQLTHNQSAQETISYSLPVKEIKHD